MTLVAGDVALIDSARPVTYLNGGHEQWLSVQLPRRSLVSYLGFEPQSGALGQGNSRAGRLLYQLAQDVAETEDSVYASAGAHMQLAFYDLLCALVARPDAVPFALVRRSCLGVFATSSTTALPILISVPA